MITRKWPPIALIAIAGITIALPAHADWAQDTAKQFASFLVGRPQAEEYPHPQAQLGQIPTEFRPMRYGAREGITQSQANILTRQELAWPQSYGAVISKLGYPQARSAMADHYRLPDGRVVAVMYNGGVTAIGVEGL